MHSKALHSTALRAVGELHRNMKLGESLDHPLHLTVANEIVKHTSGRGDVIRDEACGGNQHIPLFCGAERSRRTQLCKVDLLVIKSGQVHVILEIEESGFNPTKICGKFLTSALASFYIHNFEGSEAIPYSEKVLFIQVLDGSKFPSRKTSKPNQSSLLASQIQKQLPLQGSSLSEYRLFIVNGVHDRVGLEEVGRAVAAFV